MEPSLYLGITRPLDGGKAATPFRFPADHLCTHGAVVGMTASGNTSLVTVMIEEPLRYSIPVLAIDINDARRGARLAPHRA
jgi:DNA helicase HerA-like ATPase